MKLQRPENTYELRKLIDQFTLKESISNNYLLPSELDSLFIDGRIHYCVSESNCYLFVEKPGDFLRLYYIVNDIHQIECFDTSMPIMTEILFRGNMGEPEDEMHFLQEMGFQLNLRRDQYSVSVSKIEGIRPEHIQTVDMAKMALDLFNASFDRFSGDYIPDEEIPMLLKDRRLLCVLNEDNELMGALELRIHAKNAWISHIVVRPKFRRLGVADKLIRMFAQIAQEKDVSRLMLWVQSQNLPAISLYEKFHFCYINKSTISLIKE